MQTLRNLYLVLSIGLFLQACNGREHYLEKEGNNNAASRLTAANVEAAAPYFTNDQQGNVVLCWTEKIDEQQGYILKYAVYHPEEKQFTEAIEVLPSKGTIAHPESMNKVAFKKDGTVVAMYAIKHASKENPFAGSIFYTLSADQGKSWTTAAYLHSNTLPVYGRSFFDMTTLPDGEVGAIWLDGRFAEADSGSALFFAKTEKGKGFGIDKQIAQSTCECCRTDIYVDTQDLIHIAYRDILFSSAVVGEQVRDIAHIISKDNGQSFSQIQRISADNWAIDGCPHTGPSLASNKAGLHAAWFTAGRQPGLYYTFAEENFSGNIQLLSKSGRHPQLLALSGDQLVIVWEEIKIM